MLNQKISLQDKRIEHVELKIGKRNKIVVELLKDMEIKYMEMRNTYDVLSIRIREALEILNSKDFDKDNFTVKYEDGIPKIIFEQTDLPDDKDNNSNNKGKNNEDAKG